MLPSLEGRSWGWVRAKRAATHGMSVAVGAGAPIPTPAPSLAERGDAPLTCASPACASPGFKSFVEPTELRDPRLV